MKKWHMNKYLLTVSLVLLVMTSQAIGQDALSIDRAIEEALVKNTNVQVSRSQVTIRENQATYGNAGLLPSVTGSGTFNYGVNETKIQLANSPETIETSGAASTTVGADVRLNYTIFSGFKNKRNYDKLELAVAQTKFQSQQEIESILLQVASGYYNLARALENQNALESNKQISRERLKRAQLSKQLSGGRQIDVLNAQVSFNQDSLEAQKADQAVLQAMVSLNQILGRPLDQEIELDTDAELPQLESLDQLKAQMANQNPSQLSMRIQEQISMLDYKISKSAYIPQLSFQGAYAYNRNEAEGSFLAVNESLGYNVGLSLSVPIYAGGTKRTAQKNAQIQLENSKLQLADLERSLERDLIVAYGEYQNAMSSLELEQSSLETAELNFELSKEQLRVGQISQNDFRNAQINLLLVQNSLNNLRFNVHLAALEVLRISGGLMRT